VALVMRPFLLTLRALPHAGAAQHRGQVMAYGSFLEPKSSQKHTKWLIINSHHMSQFVA